MTLSFHPAAKEEFRDAARWYAGQRRGLGDEFIAAVEQGLRAMPFDNSSTAPTRSGNPERD